MTQLPLQFDSWGYLIPDKPIVVSLDLFREMFGFNEYRRDLLQQHADLLTQLRAMGIRGIDQWVDGSFVTTKPLPNDLDVVTFVPFDLHQQHEQHLRELFAEYDKLDAYAIRVFPESHPKHFLTTLDGIEWLSLFTRSRKDPRTNRRHAKGFVCLTLN